MKILLVHLSILVLALSSSKADSPPEPQCAPGEVYLTCGPPYQKKCEDLRSNSGGNMAAVCVMGCFCESGFVRDSTGSCVPESSCPPTKCEDPNAQYSDCKDKCPITCENRNKPNICTMECQMPGGCRCKPGYVKGPGGLCILPESCPVASAEVCPTDPNAFVSPCGDPCPTTCENKDDTRPRPCPRICLRNGCKCKEGYVKGPNGRCILPTSCPSRKNKVCPTDPNAIVLPCGDPCPTTCENKDDTSPRPCPRICLRNGCKCKEGFVKGPNGLCIIPRTCITVCRNPNEVFSDCGDVCRVTCENKDEIRPCPYICKHPGECVCKEGYVRDSENRCILPEHCEVSE